MAGPSPAMTWKGWFNVTGMRSSLVMIRTICIGALTALAASGSSAAAQGFDPRTPSSTAGAAGGMAGADMTQMSIHVRSAPPPSPAAAGAATEVAADRTTPALKSMATVTGAIVRIGDLVENAGAVADVAIFRAPDLGETGSVAAGRVIDAVRAHHIVGLDTRGLAEVVVTRASRAITAKDIEGRIVRALAGQSGAADPKSLAVTFDREVRRLYVEPSADAELAVSRQNFDQRTGRFDLTLDLPAGATARRTLRFTGSLAETVETAVVTRSLAQGDVIRATDVAIERRPRADFPAGTLVALDQAVGFAAKRALRAGQAVRPSDLTKPELVGRNETVTIVYEVPGIVLTMRGKALEAGSEGDLINVLNVQSNRTIQTTVIGSGSVSVAGPRFAADGGASNRRRTE